MSELKVDKITPRLGTTLTLGDTGDTINFGSGVLPNFENLTVTGDLTVDTNSLYVDSANNKVGIGTTSPDSYYSDQLVISCPAEGGVTLVSQGTTQASYLCFADGTTGNEAYRGYVRYSHNTDSLQFASAAAINMTIDSSGNVGIGTSSPSYTLQVDHQGSENVTVVAKGTAPGFGLYDTTTSAYNWALYNSNGDLTFYNTLNTNGFNSLSEKMRIDSSGQVLINRTSAQTTAAYFEVFGSSFLQRDHTSSAPSGNISNLNYPHALALANRNGSTDTNICSLGFDISTTGAVTNGAFTYESTAAGVGDFAFYNENGNVLYESMRIDGSTGRVGIGTSSPECTLHVQGSQLKVKHSTNSFLTLEAGSSSYQNVLEFSDGGASGAFTYNHPSNYLATKVNGSEAMRIDSSGFVFVGQTSRQYNATGVSLNPSGYSHFVADNGYPLLVNRKSSDGEIVNFYRDATRVGSIISTSGNLIFDGGNGKTGLRVANDGIIPRDNGSDVDNGVDLGASSLRFKDLYLGGNIYLGGTGSANALDDYEEGNWTPNYSTESGGESVTYDGLTSGKYIKVGQMVFITGYIRTDAFSGGGSYVYLGGFPFTSATGNAFKSFIGVSRSTTWGGDFPSACEVVDGGTKAFLKYRTSANSGSDNIIQSDMATGGNSNVLIFSGTYKSSS